MIPNHETPTNHDEIESIETTSSLSTCEPSYTIVSNLPQEARIKLEVIQSLLEPCDRQIYGERLREGSTKLGVSVRTLQRLFKKYQEQGLAALVSSDRSDKGTHRISEFWQTFIVNLYKKNTKITGKQLEEKVKTKAIEIKDEQPPDYRTILRVIQPIKEKQEKADSIRTPGWRGSKLSLKTRDDDNLDIRYSNQVWQSDHTRADVLLVDQHGELLGRPWLTTVIDSYSRCVMGLNLGFDAPSSQVVALALRHAILPKHYGEEYKLNQEWDTYGTPEYLFTDGGKDFRSDHLGEIAGQLGFVLKLRARPSEGGIVERPFKTLNQSLFSKLPGYTGSNIQERPKEAEKTASLTLRELEQLIVRYIVTIYNQDEDARTHQTRYERWQLGLQRQPQIIPERELDICLMKVARRTIQRGGYLQFENLFYRGEHLGGYAGDTVILRYDPNDITTLWVYRREKGKEVFLSRAHAQELETESLSLNEAQASAKRLRSSGKRISNEAIVHEVMEREALVQEKTRKQRQKNEQAYKKEAKSSTVEETETVELQEETPVRSEIEDIEVWDYDQLRDDYGW